MKRILFSLASVVLFASLAMADGIRLGFPAYGGSGCPQGSAAVALSPDNTALSILFDEYMAEAGGPNGRRLARKSCNLAIPLHVPQGFSVSLIKTDYRGFNSLPYGAYARFNTEVFFAGHRGPRTQRTFRGQLEDDFFINNSNLAIANVWSRCGQDVNLRVNTSILVRTNRRKEEAFTIVDSVDIEAGLIFHLKWRRC